MSTAPASDQIASFFSRPSACALAMVSYDSARRWAEVDLVVPSIAQTGGREALRFYSLDDLLLLSVIGRLREAGVPLEWIRRGIDQLRSGCQWQANARWFVVGADGASPRSRGMLLQGI